MEHTHDHKQEEFPVPPEILIEVVKKQRDEQVEIAAQWEAAARAQSAAVTYMAGQIRELQTQVANLESSNAQQEPTQMTIEETQ